MTAPVRCDVAILGAGAAGAALAVRLAAMGARVVLVDARAGSPADWPDKPGERLPAQTRFALNDLGIAWESLTQPEAGIKVHWSGPSPQNIATASAPALLCGRNDLDAALMERAQALGVKLLTGHHFCGVEGQPGRWCIQMKAAQMQEVEAALLVDASGRRAVLAQGLGQEVIRRDDAMIGLLRWWQGGPASPAVFHLEAIAGGWCYASALPGGRGVMGFVTLRGLAQGRPLPLWLEAWHRADLIRKAVPGGVVWGPVASFAAGPGLAAQLVGPGWARVGDAAAQGDPIEGRGVLRALQGAQHLAALIGADAAAQGAVRRQYQDVLVDWHQDHLTQRRLVYGDSDRLGPAFQAGIAAGPRAACA